MYFGSVKFFKHLIYTVVFGWIAIATFLAVFFGIRLFIETHKEQPAEPAAELINIPDGTDIEQLFLIMTAKGYSNEEMLDMIRETDEETRGKLAITKPLRSLTTLLRIRRRSIQSFIPIFMSTTRLPSSRMITVRYILRLTTVRRKTHGIFWQF